ncbi:MAG: cyclohydrolase [Rhodoglobus sp.]|nr:cyclohydrolase [Rhodoglobus sp.]
MDTQQVEFQIPSAQARAEMAVAVLLESLGYDVTGDRLRATPQRVATSLRALLTRPTIPTTTFLDSEGYDGVVLVRDIPFHSLCEHHLLPFRGLAHIGYIPRNRLVGLSTMARIVEYFSRDLQVQERLTTDIATWLETELDPRGVGVVIDAEHLCMSMRDVGTPATRTTTSAFRGELTSLSL